MPERPQYGLAGRGVGEARTRGLGRGARLAGLLVVAALACAKLPPPASFDVANESSYDIGDIRVRSAGDQDGDWGQNLLEGVLAPGEVARLDLSPGVWDVRCETRGGDILRYDEQRFEGGTHRLIVFDAAGEDDPEALGIVEAVLDPGEAAFVEGCIGLGEVSEAACRCLVLRARTDGTDLADPASIDAESLAEALARCAEETAAD